MTIAQLGIAVDSSQVKSATTALNQFNQASSSAAKGADNLAQAGQKSVSNLGAVDAAAKRAGISTKEMQARVDAASASHNKMAAASQTAVKGIQQLSAQASKTANDNKALGDQTEKTTGSLEKFATRFTRGLIAGAAIAAVQQLTKYLFDLNAQLAATADTAQRINVGGQQFQGLQTAAGFKGIGNSDFNAAMISFNQQVGLARNGLGELRTLLASNGQTVSDTASALGRVADLVQRATGDYNKQVSILQQAGLPATQQWVRLFEQGGSAIQKIADSSTKLSNQQLDEARKLNDKWNELWTNFENWGKKAVVNVAGFLSGIGSIGAGPQTERAPIRVNIPTGGSSSVASGPAPFDPELAKRQIALEQQRLSLLGPLTTAEEARRQVELQIQSAGLNNVNIDGKRAEVLKRLAYETNLGITATKASVDALNIEAQTIGMSAGQAAAYSAAQTVLNEKKRLGIEVSDAQRAAIISEAEAMGRAKDSVEQLRFAHDTFQSSFVDFGQQLRNSASAWDAFKTAGANALGKIADKLASMAADNLWKAAFGGSSGLGGLLGGLFGGGATSSATGYAMSSGLGAGTGGLSFPMFADGGSLYRGWGIVGERGPELINVHSQGVTVIPNHISKPYLPGFADGGMLSQGGNVTRLPFGQNNAPVTVSMPISVDASGSEPGDIAKAVRGYVNSPDFDAKVVSAVTSARKRNVKI